MANIDENVEQTQAEKAQAEQTQEKQKSKEKIQTEDEQQWNKERQRAEQAEANLKKVLADKNLMVEQLSDYESQIAQLEGQIRTTAKHQEELEELDPNSADIPDLVKQNKKLFSELKNTKTALSKLEALATEFQKRETARDAEVRKQEIIEKILKPLDEEFGGKYRNTAKKMADELVNLGQENQPKDAFDAYLLLYKCYKKLKKDDATQEAQKKNVSPDSGAGGVDYRPENVKEGTFKEVLAEMRKKFSK